MITTVTRKIEWDAAHRLKNNRSKCATLHGHRYVALITVRAEGLNDSDQVVDFSIVKSLVGSWVDTNWDHTTILNQLDGSMIEALRVTHTEPYHRRIVLVPGDPTAELLAVLLLRKSQELLDGHRSRNGLVIERVRLYETPNCYAEVSISDELRSDGK